MPEYSQLRRALLTPLAEGQGLSYDQEHVEPGRSDQQKAYHFMSCGCDLLSAYLTREGIPTTDRKTAKRGTKWLAESFGDPPAQIAAGFLAHALSAWLEEVRHRGGAPEVAAVQRDLRAIIQRVYLLDDEVLALVDECRAEYRVMDTHEVRDRTKVLTGGGTGYHMALLDPEWTEAESPDDDPELVEVQMNYAGRYLRGMAGIHAIRITIGEERFRSIEAKLLYPDAGPLAGMNAIKQGLADATWWSAVADEWDEYAAMALDPIPDVPPLDDPTAQGLRQRADELLDPEQAPRLPPAVGEAMSRLATDVSDSESEFHLASDALVFGYRMREAEMEMLNWNGFDPESAARFAEWHKTEPEMAVAGGALHVADQLPAPFGGPDEVWEALQSWGSQEARTRSAGRQHHEMEDGGPPDLSDELVERMFAIGYGLGFTHHAIANA